MNQPYLREVMNVTDWESHSDSTSTSPDTPRNSETRADSNAGVKIYSKQTLRAFVKRTTGLSTCHRM